MAYKGSPHPIKKQRVGPDERNIPTVSPSSSRGSSVSSEGEPHVSISVEMGRSEIENVKSDRVPTRGSSATATKKKKGLRRFWYMTLFFLTIDLIAPATMVAYPEMKVMLGYAKEGRVIIRMTNTQQALYMLYAAQFAMFSIMTLERLLKNDWVLGLFYYWYNRMSAGLFCCCVFLVCLRLLEILIYGYGAFNDYEMVQTWYALLIGCCWRLCAILLVDLAVKRILLHETHIEPVMACAHCKYQNAA